MYLCRAAGQHKFQTCQGLKYKASLPSLIVSITISGTSLIVQSPSASSTGMLHITGIALQVLHYRCSLGAGVKDTQGQKEPLSFQHIS